MSSLISSCFGGGCFSHQLLVTAALPAEPPRSALPHPSLSEEPVHTDLLLPLPELSSVCVEVDQEGTNKLASTALKKLLPSIRAPASALHAVQDIFNATESSEPILLVLKIPLHYSLWRMFSAHLVLLPSSPLSLMQKCISIPGETWASGRSPDPGPGASSSLALIPSLPSTCCVALGNAYITPVLVSPQFVKTRIMMLTFTYLNELP